MERYVAIIDGAVAHIPGASGKTETLRIVRFAEDTDGESLHGHVLLKNPDGTTTWWKIASTTP